ncbi:MAG: ATP-dependent chaperone ClpB, partial [Desulfobacteraceae bacterium]
NIGSQIIKEFAGKDKEKMTSGVMEMLQATFKPEFLNRIDETIVFNSLGKEEIKRIVDIQIDQLTKRLLDHKISLQLTNGTREFLADIGFDPIYGARPLKRAIQHQIEDELALKILSGAIVDGDSVNIGVEDGKVVFK